MRVDHRIPEPEQDERADVMLGRFGALIGVDYHLGHVLMTVGAYMAGDNSITCQTMMWRVDC